MSRHRLPMALALAALVFVGVVLAFEHFNGGVRSHHLLNRRDLPAISNWLGLVTLPALAFALGVRLRRMSVSPRRALIAVVGSLLYGAALATSFQLGWATATNVLFFSLLILAIALPIYRAEFLVGFVAGMAVTFGAVLPFAASAVFAGLSAAIRLGAVAIARLGGTAAKSNIGRT